MILIKKTKNKKTAVIEWWEGKLNWNELRREWEARKLRN